MLIEIFYGERQQFRYRHADINILGRIIADDIPTLAEYRLNGGSTVGFYVESEVGHNSQQYAWGAKTPSVFRLQNLPGWFNIEIPIESPELIGGLNEIVINVGSRSGTIASKNVHFSWDPSPVTLPLKVGDVCSIRSIQEIGQAVNGLFELDYASHGVRSVAPVAPDALFLIGSPYGSQEATYEVMFTADRRSGIYAGLSDFFVGHSEQWPDLGIKPGYSTTGLATLSPSGWAQLWIANGDCLTDKPGTWVERSQYPSRFPVQSDHPYRVRHQVFMTPEMNAARFRIWSAEESEPADWLCVLARRPSDANKTVLARGSFGLFQFGGHATIWRDIRVRPLNATTEQMNEILQWRHSHLTGPFRKVQKAVLDRWTRALSV